MPRVNGKFQCWCRRRQTKGLTTTNARGGEWGARIAVSQDDSCPHPFQLSISVQGTATGTERIFAVGVMFRYKKGNVPVLWGYISAKGAYVSVHKGLRIDARRGTSRKLSFRMVNSSTLPTKGTITSGAAQGLPCFLTYVGDRMEKKNNGTWGKGGGRNINAL